MGTGTLTVQNDEGKIGFGYSLNFEFRMDRKVGQSKWQIINHKKSLN